MPSFLRPRRFLARLLIAFLLAAADLKAQIPVGLLGVPGNPFTNTPPASEWATRDTLLGDSSTFNSPAQLDAWAQTLDQSTITNPLQTTSAIGTSRVARHNTAQSYLVTHPAGVPAVILKATLRNMSGSTIYSLAINYDYGVAIAGPAENVPGQRVYFNLTGQSNTWQLIPELSGLITSTNASAHLLLGGWHHGSDLYLLWLDDNAVTNPEGAHTIDNFAVSSVIPFDPSPIVITNSPQSLIVNERDSATFEVIAGGFPRTYYWFSNNVPVPGNNRSTFTIPSVAYPAHDNAEIHVVISNSLNVVTSEVATLTVVQDSIPPVLLGATGQVDPTRVWLTFSEALQPDSVTVGSFVLYESTSSPDLGLLIHDAALTNGSNVVLTTEARTPGANYVLQVLDLRDDSSAHNLINPNPTVFILRQQIILIGFDDNNLWNYSTETNLFGTGWEMPGYDDSGETWASGPAGLGLDTSANGVPIRTTLPYPMNSAPQFFRRHFLLPALTNGLSLTMRHLFEDGAVVFINGREAGRYNVLSNPLSVATRATVAQADPTPISGPVSLPITNVHHGDNVIAVVVVQSGGTSVDIEMALELTADIPAYPQGPVQISVQPASTMLVEGAALELSVTASGVLPITYQWRKGNSELFGETNAVLVRSRASPEDVGSYTVIVANSFGSVTSSVANVFADFASTAFHSAVGETNLTNILLTVTDRYVIGETNLVNAANYSVQALNFGMPVTVHSASILNETNVLLTTSPRTPWKDYVVTQALHDRSPAQNPVLPATRPLISKVVVLAPDGATTWRYYAATTPPAGLDWPLNNYPDTSWSQGLAGFGSSNAAAGMPPGFNLFTTNLAAPFEGGPVTTYYRVQFLFPGSIDNARLEILGVMDDGVIAYLNGVEAGRLRMTNHSPVSFTNLSSGPAPQSGPNYVVETLPLTNLSSLVKGPNLLAIELHQAAPLSSDVALSIHLVAGTDHFDQEDPILRMRASINPTNGAITLTWAHGRLVEASELLLFGTVWTDVPGDPTSPYTFTPAPGTQRFFRVRTE